MPQRSHSSTGTPSDRIGSAVARQNHILARLPQHELSDILSRARLRVATTHEVFFEQSERIQKVYFPVTGVASIVTEMNDGTAVEALAIGREGFVGLPLFHGVKTHRARCICQVAGEFYELPAEAFETIIRNRGELVRSLHLYAEFAREVLMQSAACNGSHVVEQRCARWLLTTADSIDATTFNLTQEFLSQMLAVRRPGVTVAIGALEKRGLIRHHYGSVTIVDVAGLINASCECYQAIRNRHAELFGERDTSQQR